MELSAQFLLRLFAGSLWVGALVTYFLYVFDAPSKDARGDRFIQNLPLITMIMHVVLFYIMVLTHPDANYTNWSTVIRVHGALALILHKWLRMRVSRVNGEC